MVLLLEIRNGGGISSVMEDRNVKPDENKKILYVNANNLYTHSMSQSLPYDEFKFDKNGKTEDILNTPDDSNFGYFPEVDLKNPDDKKNKKQKTFILS